MKCSYTRLHDDASKGTILCPLDALPMETYCETHKLIVAKEVEKAKNENLGLSISNKLAPKVATLGDNVRTIRLEIGDNVRLSGSEVAANMAAMMPALAPAERMKIMNSASKFMLAEFNLLDDKVAPSLEELMAIELFFQTCIDVTKGLVGAKKTKLGIKARNDVVQASEEGKKREKKVAVNRSLEKITIANGKGEKAFAHTALDMCKDVFFVSEALDKDTSKLMKKFCDNILTASALGIMDKAHVEALISKAFFSPLRKFVTFR